MPSINSRKLLAWHPGGVPQTNIFFPSAFVFFVQIPITTPAIEAEFYLFSSPLMTSMLPILVVSLAPTEISILFIFASISLNRIYIILSAS